MTGWNSVVWESTWDTQSESHNMVVWKVRYEDGDREEMTASEIAHWKAPVEEVQTSKTKPKSKPARPKKTWPQSRLGIGWKN